MFQSICGLPKKPEFVIHGKQPRCLVTLVHFPMCFHLTNVLQLLKLVSGGECIGRLLFQTVETFTFFSGGKACLHAHLS